MSAEPRRGIPWGRLGVEFLVIVIGVLVALAVDQWAEGREDDELAREVMVALSSEIDANRRQIQDRINYRESLMPRLDSLQRVAEAGTRTNLLGGDVLPKGLGLSLLSDTSWETALLTQAVRHFDLGLTSLLSLTYSLQESLGELEAQLSDGIIRPEWFAAGDQAGATIFLSVLMAEVLETERSLARLYDRLLDELRDRLGDDFRGAVIEVS